MTKPDLMEELAEVVRLMKERQDLFDARKYYSGDLLEPRISRAAVELIRTHHAELEAVVRDAGYWRKLMQWHDAPKGNKYATVVFWESEPHEPENALELVNAMNRAMHNSAREG